MMVCLLLAITISSLVGVSDASAELRVSGSKTEMVIEARNASLTETLRAIGTAVNVQISVASAWNPAISGRYSGSLRYVLSRILVGYNYVLKISDSRVSVFVWKGSEVSTVRPVNLNVATSPKAAPIKPAVHGWDGGFIYRPPVR